MGNQRLLLLLGVLRPLASLPRSLSVPLTLSSMLICENKVGRRILPPRGAPMSLQDAGLT